MDLSNLNLSNITDPNRVRNIIIEVMEKAVLNNARVKLNNVVQKIRVTPSNHIRRLTNLEKRKKELEKQVAMVSNIGSDLR